MGLEMKHADKLAVSKLGKIKTASLHSSYTSGAVMDIALQLNHKTNNSS